MRKSFVKHFILGLLLGIFLTPYAERSLSAFKQTTPSATSKDSLKKGCWDAMEKEVASWTDALGMPIDPGIKKMVVVLNLLGFKTEQSCEGHENWGRPYPWIRISTATPELSQFIETRESLAKEIEDKNTKQEELPSLRQRSIKLFIAIKKASKLKVLSLYALITDFYAKRRSIDLDSMLMLTPFGFEIEELYSQGGEWQMVRTDSEKMQYLKKYQQEMDAFADFLTDYYYRS